MSLVLAWQLLVQYKREMVIIILSAVHPEKVFLSWEACWARHKAYLTPTTALRGIQVPQEETCTNCILSRFSF